MLTFLQELFQRNEELFLAGLFCFFLSLLFFALSIFSKLKVAGANAWYKPIKFSLSIGIFCWTISWIGWYLGSFPAKVFIDYLIITSLGFAITYIGIQAGRGQKSHFNLSTPFYSVMYSLMALAATAATLATAYIGILFFTTDLSGLPTHYLWGIRMGIIIFVIFSFQGFVMGSKLRHTIGGPDDEEGIPFLNWSKKYGDARIAHFVGMHALQIIPLLSYFLLKNTLLVMVFSLLYGGIATWFLLQALNGKPYHNLKWGSEDIVTE